MHPLLESKGLSGPVLGMRERIADLERTLFARTLDDRHCDRNIDCALSRMGGVVPPEAMWGGLALEGTRSSSG
jgi:hypothetical protein